MVEEVEKVSAGGDAWRNATGLAGNNGRSGEWSVSLLGGKLTIIRCMSKPL